MVVKNITDKEFGQYARVLKGYDIEQLAEAMKQLPAPEEVVYVPEEASLMTGDFLRRMQEEFYGGMEVQIGYCNGHNCMLNALEYHRSSEINVAITDMILMLGRQQDIEEDFSYDTSKVEAFYVPANTVVEMYATTLHYAPCGVNNEGFKCAVVLPKGTNLELDREVSYSKLSCPEDIKAAGLSCLPDDDRLLAAVNKWLIAHKDAAIEGAFNGLMGENLEV